MEQVKYIATILGGIFGGVLGGYDGFTYALTVLMIIDYVSGVLVAVNKNQLSSDIGRKGITKKVFILLMVVVGNIVDLYIIQQGNVVRTAVIFFYMTNECVSITENAGNLGLPIPKKLTQILQQIKSEDEDKETESYGDDTKKHSESK